jgi:hypothetical protein
MKTLLSIPLIILILFSGVSVKFASHFCGGSYASTKVSLTGELATCGMEHPSVNNSLQDIYRNNCCNDIISAYSICNNYISSEYNPDAHRPQVISMIFVPADYLCDHKQIINTPYSNLRPPGNYYPNSVARPALCIFRI